MTAQAARERGGMPGVLRRMRLDRVGATAAVCALVAFLNALAWAVITPPFHVPDEPQHLAYAQYFAETGKLPRQLPLAPFSQEEAVAADAVRFNSVVGNAKGRPPWTAAEGAGVQAALARHLSRRSQGGAINTTNNPPLYYALEILPYRAAASGTLLDRLYAMRALSALLAGFTVLFVFLFLRELLPRSDWTWPVGALAVAFQPVFGFLGGGVNNDDLLYVAGAATFFLLARGFRAGLTPKLGAALGAAVGLGLITKANMLGLLPGIALAVVAMVWRAWSGDRRAALIGAAAGLAVAAIPVVVYASLNEIVWDRPLWGSVAAQATGGVAPAGHKAYSNRELVSYTWQFYLPRLPFQDDQFTYYPLWETWFKGFIGRFGWLDFSFPGWVYWFALGVVGVVLGLAGAALARARGVLRRRWAELLSYLTMIAGLLGLIAIAGYRGRIDTGGNIFEQARYLLPLLPLYAAIVALAAKGVGRRWGPAAGAVLVVLALGHGLFAQLLTIGRFYA